MVITKIERQKKNRHRVSVYLDGDFAFGLNDEAVYRFGLHKGMELDDARRAEIERYDQGVQAKRVAERYIGMRMRSEREVRQRLREKEFPEEVIEETVEVFRRVRLIDDRSFAEAWVRDRLLLRPRAPALLRAELRRKGVAADIIEEVLAAQFDEGDVDALASEMAAQY
ncbi:MAG: RecX family transcriptional regulator, partial [Bacteroidetes bacterium]|nr:RecX family transcriptional regulator [Bacteroidota bacterium]